MFSLVYFVYSLDYAMEICQHNVTFSSCLSYLKDYLSQNQHASLTEYISYDAVNKIIYL